MLSVAFTGVGKKREARKIRKKREKIKQKVSSIEYAELRRAVPFSL